MESYPAHCADIAVFEDQAIKKTHQVSPKGGTYLNVIPEVGTTGKSP
jgi:hypothetical protein